MGTTDTMHSPHITRYCHQIKQEWDCAEESRNDPNRKVRVERRNGWAVWIDEPNVLVTDGELAVDDYRDVIRRLTGWAEEKVWAKIAWAEETGGTIEFIPDFRKL